ncbi:MAG: glycosyltransferase family 1 protein [Dehalococcoidia bacterium]|nr:glycosyltransferase family 1 protein [Dehalococcoidia bacterium]
MRIGIDCTAAVAEGAGIGRFTRELVGALLARTGDDRYVLLGPCGSRPLEGMVMGGNAEWRTLPFSSRMASILWHRLHLPLSVERFTGRLDVFHATDYTLPPLSKAAGAVTIHDLSFIVHPEFAEPRLVRFLEREAAASVRAAELVLADSESSRADIINYFGASPGRVAVVYGGVSDSFHPISDPAALPAVRQRYELPEAYLLGVGRIEPRKNWAGLVTAYRSLRDRMPDAPPLVIAGGRGWLCQPIFDAVEALGLSNHVRFLGYVPDQDLPALLTGATCFLFPSFYEGFGLPPLEAMACGTPVIAGNTSSLPEVLGDAALLVDPRDIAGIADAMFQVLTHPELRDDLQLRGLGRVQGFRWDQAAERLSAAYHLLDRSSAVPVPA